MSIRERRNALKAHSKWYFAPQHMHGCTFHAWPSKRQQKDNQMNRKAGSAVAAHACRRSDERECRVCHSSPCLQPTLHIQRWDACRAQGLYRALRVVSPPAHYIHRSPRVPAFRAVCVVTVHSLCVRHRRPPPCGHRPSRGAAGARGSRRAAGSSRHTHVRQHRSPGCAVCVMAHSVLM